MTPDWYPTVLAMTGTKGDDRHNALVDGISLAPLLGDPARYLGRPAVYWHYSHYHRGGATPYTAVRAGSWRLIEFYDIGRTELYDLARHPGEAHDLAAEQPAKAAELRSSIDNWRRTVGAQAPRPNPEYRGPLFRHDGG
jgi:arylsulfatase A